MESQVIRVESDSEPGKFYVVDTATLTCTCAYHNRKLRMLPLNDPHRLCKHLVKVFADKGVQTHSRHMKKTSDGSPNTTPALQAEKKPFSVKELLKRSFTVKGKPYYILI